MILEDDGDFFRHMSASDGPVAPGLKKASSDVPQPTRALGGLLD